jgi:phosphohistidine phosphatase SixA
VIFVVRRAEAGRRTTGADDHVRPLSGQGRRQARVLVSLLGTSAVGDIYNSPYVRCVEAVAPLATCRRRAVSITEALAEGGSIEPVLDVLLEAREGSVLSTHGDMLTGAVERLMAQGTDVREPVCFDKGVVWVLARREGVIAEAIALPPTGRVGSGRDHADREQSMST